MLVVSAGPGLQAGESSSSAHEVAFVGVNVVPMDRNRVLNNQTVLVRDGLMAKEVGMRFVGHVPADVGLLHTIQKRFGCHPGHAGPLGSDDYVTPRGVGRLGYTALRRILDA
jgi:hypothetical protein